MQKNVSILAAALLALALDLLAPPSGAQTAYPTRPIRLISPFPAGGGNDTLSRLVAAKFSEAWGQQVIVDNRPGGNTIIGTEALARSAPDGYTLMCAGGGHVLVPLIVRTPYSDKDFAPIGTFAKGELILVANRALPVATLQELIALAKARPGQINYATYGTGTSSHLGMELVNMLAGTRMQHVPYKGGAPAITDLLAGQVEVYLSVVPSVVGHIKSGRLKALAVSGDGRLPALPQVPTFAEAGLAGVEVKTWHSLLAPAGTPKEIVDRISAELARIVAQPDVQAKLAGFGVQPYFLTTPQFVALMQADRERYVKIIKAANLRFDG
jgi:tripartite-type tricarboxylate transporter receptor subunit TctC